MILRFGGFTLDKDRAELTGPGGAVALEPKAFALLVLLAENHDRVVDKDEMIEVVWGGRFLSDAAVTTVVKQVRRALGDDGAAQGMIRTVRGRGYRLVAPVEVRARAAARAPVGRMRRGCRRWRGGRAADGGGAALCAGGVARGAGCAGRRDPGRDHLGPVAAAVVAGDCAGVVVSVPGRIGGHGGAARHAGGWLCVVRVGRGRGRATGGDGRSGRDAGRPCDLVRALCGRGGRGDGDPRRDLCAVATALDQQIPMAEAAEARLKPVEALDAWGAYHLGLHHMYRFNRQDNAMAAGLSRRRRGWTPVLPMPGRRGPSPAIRWPSWNMAPTARRRCGPRGRRPSGAWNWTLWGHTGTMRWGGSAC